MKSIHILVVEDDPTISIDICFILESCGYQIVGPTHNVDTALAYLKKDHVDLAILDINLNSDKSGIDLAHEINKKFGIPFIYLTSYSDEHTLRKAVETYPSTYIVKPFKEEDFKPAIEIALAQKNHQSNSTIPPLDVLNKKLISELTKTEYEVLGYLTDGQTIKEIAKLRFNSENTIKTHVKNIYSKVNVSTRLELFSFLKNLLVKKH